MALYIPHSIFHFARLLYVRPETFGPYYVSPEMNVRVLNIFATVVCSQSDCDGHP